jgi:uncharacterized protein (DUF2235 family)
VGKQIVFCLDGTNNQVKAVDNTNVLRMYQLLDHSDASRQVSFYQPGVGTFSSPAAWTPVSRDLSKMLGLAFGVGLRQNLGSAYAYLMNTYEPGDEIYVFGFSRGTYTARALTGMLAVFGLFRSGCENLIPYAISAMSTGDPDRAPRTGEAAATPDMPSSAMNPPTPATRDGRASRSPATAGGRAVRADDHWRLVFEFAAMFASRASNDAIPVPVRYLGIWDTVKAAGTFRGEVVWPYTRHLPHVDTVRHAMAIDEWRRPYVSYAVEPLTPGPLVTKQDLAQVWFAGVHSDVGGMFPSGGHLSNIPFKWIAQEAVRAGLRVNKLAYDDAQRDVAAADATAAVHRMSPVWLLAGGRKLRRVPTGADVHSSVEARLQADHSYEKRLPGHSRSNVNFVDPEWLTSVVPS